MFRCGRMVVRIAQGGSGMLSGQPAVEHLLREMFPGEPLRINWRPGWLKGLELDIAMPLRKVAFEYQGMQHYIVCKNYGQTARDLQEVQGRDALKFSLCRHNHWFLFHITKQDCRTLAALTAKLTECLSSHPAMPKPRKMSARAKRKAQRDFSPPGWGLENLSHYTDYDLSFLAQHAGKPRLREEAAQVLAARRRTTPSILPNSQGMAPQTHAGAETGLTEHG